MSAQNRSGVQIYLDSKPGKKQQKQQKQKPQKPEKQARHRSRSGSRRAVTVVTGRRSSSKSTRSVRPARPMRVEKSQQAYVDVMTNAVAVSRNKPLAKELLSFLLPAESKYVVPLPDESLDGQDVVPVKTFHTAPLELSDLQAYADVGVPTVDAMTSRDEVSVWNELSTQYRIIHVGDSRLSYICPSKHTVQPDDEGNSTYICNVLANVEDINANNLFQATDTPVQVRIRSSAHYCANYVNSYTLGAVEEPKAETREPEVRPRDTDMRSLRHDVKLRHFASPNADVTIMKVFKIGDSGPASLFGLTDFTPLTRTTNVVPEAYGSVHPPVFFTIGGIDVATIWIDASTTRPADVRLRFHITAPAPAGDTPTLAFDGGLRTGQGASLTGGLLDPITLQVLNVNMEQDSASLSVYTTLSTLQTVTVTNGSTPVLEINTSLTSSGYYAFKLVGSMTAFKETVSDINPEYRIPPVFAVLIDSLRIQTYTTIVTRHVVNPNIIGAILGPATGEGQGDCLLQTALCAGSSLLLTNSTPAIYLGGYFRGYRYTTNSLWFNKTCLTGELDATIQATNSRRYDIQSHNFSNGAYSVYKPKNSPMARQLCFSFIDPITGNRAVQIKSFLTQPNHMGMSVVNPYNLMLVEYPQASGGSTTYSTKVFVTATQKFQFTTVSQLFRTVKLPNGKLDELLIKALTNHPTFAENPFHFMTMLKDFVSGVKTGLGAVAKVGSAAAPIVGQIGNALMGSGDPRLMAAGNLLSNGAAIGGNLSGTLGNLLSS